MTKNKTVVFYISLLVANKINLWAKVEIMATLIFGAYLSNSSSALWFDLAASVSFEAVLMENNTTVKGANTQSDTDRSSHCKNGNDNWSKNKNKTKTKLASRWKSGSLWTCEIYPFCDFKVKMTVALAVISCIIRILLFDNLMKTTHLHYTNMHKAPFSTSGNVSIDNWNTCQHLFFSWM